MTPEDFMSAMDALWPGNDLPAPVLAELSRRVAKLPLDTEQARATLTEYRINCPKYEIKTPHAGTIYAKLRATAYPAGSAKPSGGSSEYQPTPLSGRAMGLREFAAEKRRLGEKVYETIYAIAGKSPEEVERHRKERERQRLNAYGRRT